MIRRRKFQINPNIGTEKQKNEGHTDVYQPNEMDYDADGLRCLENTDRAMGDGESDEEGVTLSFQTEISKKDKYLVQSSTVEEASRTRNLFQRPMKQGVTCATNQDVAEIIQSSVDVEEEPLSFQRHKDVPENAVNIALNSSFYANSDAIQIQRLQEKKNVEAKRNRRKRSSIKIGEELDTKKFTLADLIDWHPSTENTLRKKWDDRRQQIIDSGVCTEIAKINGSGNDVKQPIAPRVKVNEKGELVVDEESLVVIENAESNVWETVNDDLMPKKLNSMSFRKYRRTTLWTVIETDLFYEVLSATGTDFGLMHEFIPTRSRAELKKKFNREEKLDEERVNEILSKPTLLDETLYERVKKLSKKVEDEQKVKAAKKEKKLKKNSGGND